MRKTVCSREWCQDYHLQRTFQHGFFSVHIRSFISVMVLMMCVALSAPLAANAADRDIPLNVLSTRDRLLGERQRLLYMRSDLNARLTSMLQIQTDLDKMLNQTSSCSAQYDELRRAKSKMIGATNDMQARLDWVEKGLITNNQDISNVDYQIQRFACMR